MSGRGMGWGRGCYQAEAVYDLGIAQNAISPVEFMPRNFLQWKIPRDRKRLAFPRSRLIFATLKAVENFSDTS